MTTLWPLGFDVGEKQGRQRWGSGDCVKGVSFSPLRASEKRFRSSLLLNPVNLGSRASYSHDGRGPLPTDPVVTPPFKILTGEASGTQSLTEPTTLRSTQQRLAYSLSHMPISLEYGWHQIRFQKARSYPAAHQKNITSHSISTSQFYWHCLICTTP
jgi:hypothetical protein